MQPGGHRDKQHEARAGRAGLAADSALALVLAVVLTVATYFVSQHRASVRTVDAGAAALQRDGLSGGTFNFAADLRYRGQEHTIPVAVAGPDDLFGAATGTRQRFNVHHDSRYGHAAGHSCIAVVGPNGERSITVETGKSDRIDNMRAFTIAALDLLEKGLS